MKTEYNIIILNNIIDFVHLIDNINFDNINDKKYSSYINKIKKINKIIVDANNDIKKINKDEMVKTFLNLLQYKSIVVYIYDKVYNVYSHDEKINNLRAAIFVLIDNLNNYYNNIYHHINNVKV